MQSCITRLSCIQNHKFFNTYNLPQSLFIKLLQSLHLLKVTKPTYTAKQQAFKHQLMMKKKWKSFVTWKYVTLSTRQPDGYTLLTIKQQLTALKPVLKIWSLSPKHITRESFTPWWLLVDCNQYKDCKYIHVLSAYRNTRQCSRLKYETKYKK